MASQVIPTSLPSSRTHRQTDIDNELAILAQRMQALRTHRNSFSHVSSIPPEILGAVFVHLARHVQSLHPPDAPAVLSWLNVAHVSRHWRDVALANPELWATPFLNSSNATEEMLIRSKMAPLILRTGRRYRIDCVEKAFQHVDRLQEVSLDCPNSPTHHMLDFLGKLSSSSALILQSLSLDGGITRRPRIAIPTSFSAPNLRRLQISHCDLSWASPVLTGLTVLDIKSVSVESLPTLDGLISVLRRMPALHTLSLEGALPILPHATKSLPHTPRAMNVQLPHLARLRLVGKMLEVANVLARIELPDSTTLEVLLECRVFSSGSGSQEWNASLPIISRALESCFKPARDKSRRTPRSMRLSANNTIRLQYGTVRHPASWVKLASETSTVEWTSEFPVTLDVGFPGEANKAMLKKLYRLVPLVRLEALYIEGYFHPCWDGFWNDVLGHTARNLAYIHLRGTSQLLNDLLKSMRSQNLKHSVSRSIANRSRRGPVFAPALSHLILENIEFTREFIAFCSFSMTYMPPCDLRDVLIDRVNDGRGLDKLTVTGCIGIDAHHIKLLREVVANVEWDEYEDPDNYDFDYDDEYDSLYGIDSDGIEYYHGGFL
ncbi:hypothetical protein AZE42_09943 [Rhizopogon vesiculosus]|uniref:F-box domain-containing protein n=1 Tax=Rhizopogon vesiculosus TaxID=180088 RepID=A0A1J8PLF3_9AGAM|nr:hypothetical protein AZE42_09943 [Rhizopogon vesiculosus]